MHTSVTHWKYCNRFGPIAKQSIHIAWEILHMRSLWMNGHSYEHANLAWKSSDQVSTQFAQRGTYCCSTSDSVFSWLLLLHASFVRWPFCASSGTHLSGRIDWFWKQKNIWNEKNIPRTNRLVIGGRNWNKQFITVHINHTKSNLKNVEVGPDPIKITYVPTQICEMWPNQTKITYVHTFAICDAANKMAYVVRT